MEKDSVRPQAQPGAADRMWIRKKPFWNQKPALLNRLKLSSQAHIFSCISGLQRKNRGENAYPPPGWAVQRCKSGLVIHLAAGRPAQKKAPLGGLLWRIQTWPTEGARSRNHMESNNQAEPGSCGCPHLSDRTDYYFLDRSEYIDILSTEKGFIGYHVNIVCG
jgi:hypothetical protein